jgi:hypothetical protein
MRTYAIILALLGTIALVSAVGMFTTPEIDTTSEGWNRPRVPAPQPLARFRQATRADIVARLAEGPAKRQISTSPICNRPATGTRPYAVFTDAFFYTNYLIGQPSGGTLEQCYASCQADPSQSTLSCL